MVVLRALATVLWASICAGRVSSSSETPAGDASGLEPDWACLESCKKEMQSCIDECSGHAFQQAAFHAKQLQTTPLPQEGDNDFTNMLLPDFDYWDTDKDGLLSVNEAYRLFHFGLEQHDLLSTESAADVESGFEDFFRSIDENGDGVVSREEFDDEDDGGSTDAEEYAAKVTQPSTTAPPVEALKLAKTSHSVKAKKQPALHKGFLSRHGKRGRLARGGNSIREMARTMAALNREVHGL